MYDLRTLHRFKHLCALGLVLLGLGNPLEVKADVETSNAAFQNFISTVTAPGKQTVSFSSGGVPLVARGVPSISTGTGSPVVTKGASIGLSSGASIPITGTAKIPSAAAAAFIKKALPLIPILGTGIAIYDLAKELGFNVATSPAGVVVTKPDPAVCSVAPCTLYSLSLSGVGTFTGYTPNNACHAAIENSVMQTKYPGTTFVSADVSRCYSIRSGAPTSWPWTSVTSVAPSPPSFLPSTMSELEAAIAAKSGWPSNSFLPSALKDASTATGEAIPADQPKITGPATVAGPVKKTTVGNKETTSSTQYNCTYVDGLPGYGGEVACVEQTTSMDKVTTVDPGTGATTTTTTTASEETKPTEFTKEPTPAEDPCVKNPTRNGCRTDEFDTPTDAIPKTSKTITYQAENLGFAGGTCPANKTFQPHGMAAPITIVNWVDNCDKLTTYAKPMILAMAMFSAMMIIFVGGRTE